MYKTTRKCVAELCTQSDLGSDQHKDGFKQPTDVAEGVAYRSELYSLLVSKLNHIVATPMKEDMKQGIEQTLAETFKSDFPGRGMESAFSVFWRWLEWI